MRTLKLISMACIAGAMFVAMSAQAAMHLVAVSDLDSLDGSLYFDHLTKPNISEPIPGTNLIEIALDNFTAKGLDGIDQAHDNIRMTLTAPDGFMITAIRYNESGTWSITDGGVISATGSLIIGNDVTPLNSSLAIIDGGSAGPAPFSFTAEAAVDNLTLVELSATNTLLAASLTGIAEITKTSASIEVDLAPIPVPPAVWLFGSAIAGLIAVRRRNV